MTHKAPSDLVLHDSEPGSFAFYSWQNIVIACWSTHGTGPTMQRFARVRDALDRQHPTGVSVVWLIADRAGLPTPEARASAQQLIERYRERRAALAVVIFGEGFWLSAMRAANTGVQSSVRDKIPMQTFNRLDDAVAWLPALHESHTGVRVERDALLGVLRELSESL